MYSSHVQTLYYSVAASAALATLDVSLQLLPVCTPCTCHHNDNQPVLKKNTHLRACCRAGAAAGRFFKRDFPFFSVRAPELEELLATPITGSVSTYTRVGGDETYIRCKAAEAEFGRNV